MHRLAIDAALDRFASVACTARFLEEVRIEGRLDALAPL